MQVGLLVLNNTTTTHYASICAQLKRSLQLAVLEKRYVGSIYSEYIVIIHSTEQQQTTRRRISFPTPDTLVAEP